ncbi:methylamine utilization protein [Pseudoduganella violaceinigra]|uniref:methylamine utilization protein n=1 Tax=Pseudoduganella violaceinigra TaxID=246602 RepID=UPI0003F7D1C4|nr:methylamine utilization protein [Pseudoduganella violaceinigra]
MPSQLISRSAALAAFLCAGAAAAAAGGITVQVTDNGGKPVADAVVYLEADGGQQLPKAQKAGEISQKGLKFVPLVTVVQTGSKIYFPNNDRVRHHIYSFSAPHKFDQKLYSGTTAEPQSFDKPGTVVLGCNIHDKMIAYVRVVDTPYFGKTDASGAVVVEAPAGKYVLKAWHPDIVGGNAQEQALRLGDAAASASFKMTLKPPSTDPDTPAY